MVARIWAQGRELLVIAHFKEAEGSSVKWGDHRTTSGRSPEVSVCKPGRPDLGIRSPVICVPYKGMDS